MDIDNVFYVRRVAACHGDGDWEAAGVIVHDVTNRSIAHMLVEMPFGPFPMALGVLYDDPKPTFEAAALAEKAAASEG